MGWLFSPNKNQFIDYLKLKNSNSVILQNQPSNPNYKSFSPQILLPPKWHSPLPCPLNIQLSRSASFTSVSPPLLHASISVADSQHLGWSHSSHRGSPCHPPAARVQAGHRPSHRASLVPSSPLSPPASTHPVDRVLPLSSHTVKVVAAELVTVVAATGPIPSRCRPATGGTPTHGQA